MGVCTQEIPDGSFGEICGCFEELALSAKEAAGAVIDAVAVISKLIPLTEKQRRLEIKENDLINEITNEIFLDGYVDGEYDDFNRFQGAPKATKRYYLDRTFGKEYFNNLSIRMKNKIMNY